PAGRGRRRPGARSCAWAAAPGVRSPRRGGRGTDATRASPSTWRCGPRPATARSAAARRVLERGTGVLARALEPGSDVLLVGRSQVRVQPAHADEQTRPQLSLGLD